jgi:hypothetical protein
MRASRARTLMRCALLRPTRFEAVGELFAAVCAGPERDWHYADATLSGPRLIDQRSVVYRNPRTSSLLAPTTYLVEDI